jgi:hypothetical protein
MSRGRWAGIAAALAIAAVAVVTAGCGGGGSALALDPVAAAATKTQQTGAARIRFAIAFSGPRTDGKTLRIRGAGAVDGTSSELTIPLGSLLRQAPLLARAVPSTASAQLMHDPIKVITLEQNGDYVLYVRLGFLATRLPGGQHWVELNVSKLAQARGFDLGTLLSGSQLQPADLLSMLKAEGAKIQNLGSATVDGIATTHYRVTVDLAKALKTTGLSSPHLARMAAKMSKVPADVWIGKDGLVHQIGLSVAVARKHSTARLGLTVAVYDYGADVTIAAPPSGDVFDATQLAEMGFGSSH